MVKHKEYSNRLNNRRYLYLPLLATLIISMSMGYEIRVYGFKAVQLPTLLAIAVQAVSIYIMFRRETQKGLRLYLVGIYLGYIYYTIIHLNMGYYDHLGFTVVSIFLAVLTVFIFSDPSSYILTIFIYLFISVMYIFNSNFTAITITMNLGYIALILIVLLEAKRWMNKLHNDRVQSLKKTQSAALEILGRISEIKDSETDLHLKRVEIIISELVRYLMHKKDFSEYISDKYLEDIRAAAYLHDIGKIGISDSIINKPGKLTADEFNTIKTHTIIGYELLLEAQNKIGDESIFTLALEIARHHHEKWNGQGYPDALSKTDIPLSARIMAVVDVYDALISDRPYKKAFSHSEATAIIKEDSGIHFDPDIADTFLNHSDEIYHKIVLLYNNRNNCLNSILRLSTESQ